MIHDALIIGAGPAGSTCARFLAQGGARVALVDRAQFPRVKLCGGWISAPIWDALALTPREYPGGLWEWNTCHVSYRGEERAIPCRGWFIRRFELDDFLLRRSGAELHLGVAVQRDRARRRRALVGRRVFARGSWSAPAARTARSRGCVAPPRPQGPVGVQEHEFRADPAAIARTRAGRDGEPELLLHDDLRGYSWNVPKTDWLNVGSGTVEPHEVRAAWQQARAHFSAAGHLPLEAAAELDAMKGHTYYLFDPAHLDGAVGGDRRQRQGRRPPLRRQPGARSAAHRRGDPARGRLGPPGRRGDPRRRRAELPRAPRRASGARGLPARLPPARGGRRSRRSPLLGRPGGKGGAGIAPRPPRRRPRLRLDVLGRALAGAAAGRRRVGYCRALGRQSSPADDAS